MKNFDEYDEEYLDQDDDEEYVEDTLEDLIEYVLEYLDPDFGYKDFVVNRLTNLEGEFEKTSAAVTYFKRTDLDRAKWRFSYNLVIPVIPPEENIDSEEDEPRIVKTLMLDIMRNSDLIDDDKPELDDENITTETIQIGGFEVFWLGIPRVEVKK